MHQNSPVTIEAGEALEPYRAVRYNGTSWVYCDAQEKPHAITAERIASGASGIANLINESALLTIQTNEAISLGSYVFVDDDGKGSDTEGGTLLGMCFSKASGGALDTCMFIPLSPGQTRAVKQFAADGSVAVTDSGCVISNLGASGTVVVNLPSAPPPGIQYHIVVSVAQALRINPGDNDAFITGGTTTADGKYYWADDEAESIMIVSNSAGNWNVLHLTGTWTIEP